MNRSDVFTLSTIFIVSGISQPLLVEVLTYNGAFDKSTLLFVLPNYIGMSMAVMVDTSKFSNMINIAWSNVLSLSLIDMVSQGLCMLGLVYAGSSIYIVVYSGTTIWAAIFSRCLLNHELMWQQWLGVVVVVLGLSLTALDRSGTSTSNEFIEGKIGICLIVIGSVLHALTWVLIEKWTKYATERIAPEVMCTLMGLFGGFMYLLWQVVYTIPNYQTLIIDVIAAHNGRISVIATAYIFLIFVSFLHALTFYWLLGQVGCVDAGIMKGCQSVAVFVISHFAFCSVQASQCFTSHKATALVIVIVGVLIYGQFSSGMSSAPKDGYVDINSLPAKDEEVGVEVITADRTGGNFVAGASSLYGHSFKLVTIGNVLTKKLY